MSEDVPGHKIESRGVRLWAVGFIPWVLVNAWAADTASSGWLFRYWGMVEEFGNSVIAPIENETLQILVTLTALAAAVVVPYLALYYLVTLSGRAVLWVRTGGFGED